jgi:hypothetical protein
MYINDLRKRELPKLRAKKSPPRDCVGRCLITKLRLYVGISRAGFSRHPQAWRCRYGGRKAGWCASRRDWPYRVRAQAAPIFEIGGDPGAAKRMIADSGADASRACAAIDHLPGIGLCKRPIAELLGFAIDGAKEGAIAITGYASCVI